MAIPSVMAARWMGQCRHLVNTTDLLMCPLNYGRRVGQKSGPILAVCGRKYIKLSLPVREHP